MRARFDHQSPGCVSWSIRRPVEVAAIPACRRPARSACRSAPDKPSRCLTTLCVSTRVGATDARGALTDPPASSLVRRRSSRYTRIRTKRSSATCVTAILSAFASARTLRLRPCRSRTRAFGTQRQASSDALPKAKSDRDTRGGQRGTSSQQDTPKRSQVRLCRAAEWRGGGKPGSVLASDRRAPSRDAATA